MEASIAARLSGAAFLLSVLLLGAAVTLLRGGPSLEGAGTVFEIFAGLSFLGGMFGLRAWISERSPRLLLGASAVSIVALVIGSTVKISGVLLTLPVLAACAYVVARSNWRLGDVAIFGLMSAIGALAGFFLAAAIDPDTGSQGDQAAAALGGLGFLVSIAAVCRERRLPSMGRLVIGLAPVLAVAAFGAREAVGNVVQGIVLTAAGALWAAGWISIARRLWSVLQAARLTVPYSTLTFS